MKISEPGSVVMLQRAFRQRDGVRRDLAGLDGELGIFAIPVVRVDERHLVLPGRQQDVAFVARAELAVRRHRCRVGFSTRPRGTRR